MVSDMSPNRPGTLMLLAFSQKVRIRSAKHPETLLSKEVSEVDWAIIKSIPYTLRQRQGEFEENMHVRWYYILGLLMYGISAYTHS